MSAISSETLFHLTSSAEYLLGILKNEFYPRYCMERYELGGRTIIKAAFPMVCFCDIPLSQIKNHIDRYGCYGLGMSKIWAEKNGLNPVLYLRGSSDFSVRIRVILDNIVSDFRQKQKKTEMWDALVRILRYMKPYESPYFRDNKMNEIIRFYDEREWRYVVSPDKCGGKYFLTTNEYRNSIKLADENEKLKECKLGFEPGDIRYVIIKAEKEVIEMIEALKRIKRPKYDEKTIEILISRIITCDQIQKDF